MPRVWGVERAIQTCDGWSGSLYGLRPSKEGNNMSGKRLRALVGLSYPSEESLPMVKRAGGISKLSEEQLSKLKMIQRKPGDFCDDMPKSSIKALLKSGGVETVEVDNSTRKVTKKKAVAKTSRVCRGVTASGKKCSNFAVGNTHFCGSHG